MSCPTVILGVCFLGYGEGILHWNSGEMMLLGQVHDLLSGSYKNDKKAPLIAMSLFKPFQAGKVL